MPAGFTQERTWKLLRGSAAGTVALYECKAGSHTFLTKAGNCEGQFPMGPVGHAYTTQVAGSVPLYRCRSNGDHIVTTEPGCEGLIFEHLLGYALP
jgi:hypothetical protein